MTAIRQELVRRIAADDRDSNRNVYDAPEDEKTTARLIPPTDEESARISATPHRVECFFRWSGRQISHRTASSVTRLQLTLL